MNPSGDILFLVDPLQAAIAMQQGMTGGVNSPDRLLFLAGVMIGVVVLVLSVVALCALATRETTSEATSTAPGASSTLSDAEVWALASASISGFWLMPAPFREPEVVEEESEHRVAA